MNVVRIDPEQVNPLLQLLQEIRDRLPETEREVMEILDASGSVALAVDVEAARSAFGGVTHVPFVNVAMRDEKAARSAEDVVAARMPEAVALGHRQALAAFLGVLDDWIGGARENHAALDHRGEPTDDPCWTRFHPTDIRQMINDAAREMGIPEFPTPVAPKEEE